MLLGVILRLPTSYVAYEAWLDRHSDEMALVLPSHYGFRHMANHSTMQTAVGKRDLAPH